MTDVELLNEVIEKSGLKISFIAKKLGITRAGFYKKLKNEAEFKASEILILQEVLNLSNLIRDKIFFARKVDFKSTNKREEVNEM